MSGRRNPLPGSPCPDEQQNPSAQSNTKEPASSESRLSQEEVTALLDFFRLLDEWDRKSKIV